MPKGLWQGARPPLTTPFEINRDSLQAEGLVGWWPFNGGPNSSSIPEMARNGPRAALTGTPSWVFNTTLGYGVGSFSTANYVNAGNFELLRNIPSGGVLSVSAWVVRAAPGGTNSTVVSKSNAGGNGWILRQESTPGAFKFSIIRATSNSEFTTTSAFADGPHLFVGVYSGATPSIYVDGYSVAGSGTAGAGAYTVDTSDGVNIGRLGQGSGFWPFLGSIYDVRVYNVALSPAVILQMYNAATRWELYKPEVRRRVWVPAAAGGLTGSGSAAGWVGTRGQDIGSRSAGAGASSRTGARSQDIGTKSAGAAAATRAGARAQDVGSKATGGAASAEAGVRSQAIGAKAVAAATASRVGLRGQDIGAKAVLGAAASQAGTRSQDVGTKAAGAATASRAGTRAQTAGAVARGAATTGRIGATGQCTGTKSITLAPAAGAAGVRAQAAGAGTRANSATSRAGVVGQATGAQGGLKTAAGRAGVRGQAIGAKAIAAGAAGVVGARGQSVGAKAIPGSAAGRIGTEGQSAGARAAAAGAAGRTGVRGQATGAAGAPPAEVHSGTAVSSVGARGQCVGTKSVATAGARGVAGLRGVGAATRTAAAPTRGVAGAAGQCSGLGARASAAASRVGVRGLATKAVGGPAPPAFNWEECETDFALATVVYWPPLETVPSWPEATTSDTSTPLTDCTLTEGLIKPWEI